MAEFCCDRIVGGRVFLSRGDKQYEATGDFTIEAANVERTGAATASGRAMYTVASKLFKFSCDFANFCDGDPHELFADPCGFNATVVEKDRGFRHLFTNCMMTGTPSTNLSSGVIAGLAGESDQYQRIAA